MAMIDEEFLQSGLAASGMVFGCQRYDGPVVPLHYARQKQALVKKRRNSTSNMAIKLRSPLLTLQNVVGPAKKSRDQQHAANCKVYLDSALRCTIYVYATYMYI